MNAHSDPYTVQTRLDYLRPTVVALMVDCPFEPNPKDCPAFNMRQKPLQERVAWVLSMSTEELERFHAAHLECLVRKEAAAIAR
jgi:hypothetical protein